MAVHKLILDDDFEESIFTLIAIHCTIEDYRLAYLINKNLGINLVRQKNDLDFSNGKSTYSIYEWEDEKQRLSWYLVSNICKTNDVHQVKTGLLFQNNQSVTKKEKHIINTIQNIPQIITAYTIDQNQLKSKDNLIFN